MKKLFCAGMIVMILLTAGVAWSIMFPVTVTGTLLNAQGVGVDTTLTVQMSYGLVWLNVGQCKTFSGGHFIMTVVPGTYRFVAKYAGKSVTTKAIDLSVPSGIVINLAPIILPP